MKLDQYFISLKQKVLSTFQTAFPEITISPDQIKLEKTPDNEQGDFGIACFPFAKALKQAPVKISAAVAEKFDSDEQIEKMEAVGPYLNIFLRKDNFARCVCCTVLETKERFGSSNIGKDCRVMVEYSSPNTNKPLHIGHVRNNFIGMALANIMSFSGYEVIKANLINDRGIHICKSMLAYKKWGQGATPESTGKKGDHFVGEFYVRFEQELKKEREQYASQKEIDLQAQKANIALKRKEIQACKDSKTKKTAS